MGAIDVSLGHGRRVTRGRILGCRLLPRRARRERRSSENGEDEGEGLRSEKSLGRHERGTLSQGRQRQLGNVAMARSPTYSAAKGPCGISSPRCFRSCISYLLGHFARTLVASNVLSGFSSPSTVTPTSIPATSRNVSGTTHWANRTGKLTPFFAIVKRYSHGWSRF